MANDETTKITRQKPGPKIKTFDWETFAKLCEQQCTQEEIAGSFGMSISTLSNRCMQEKGKQFKELQKIFGGGGRASLRRRLWRQAMSDKYKDTVKAAIWLSKQYLQMSDKVETNPYENFKPIIIRRRNGEQLELGLTDTSDQNDSGPGDHDERRQIAGECGFDPTSDISSEAGRGTGSETADSE